MLQMWCWFIGEPVNYRRQTEPEACRKHTWKMGSFNYNKGKMKQNIQSILKYYKQINYMHIHPSRISKKICSVNSDF